MSEHKEFGWAQAHALAIVLETATKMLDRKGAYSADLIFDRNPEVVVETDTFRRLFQTFALEPFSADEYPYQAVATIGTVRFIHLIAAGKVAEWQALLQPAVR